MNEHKSVQYVSHTYLLTYRSVTHNGLSVTSGMSTRLTSSPARFTRVSLLGKKGREMIHWYMKPLTHMMTSISQT